MKNQSSIWDELYKENKNLWNKETNTLPNLLKNKKVLEIGVGNGKTLLSILKQKPSEVTAIDFSKESIKISKSLFKNKKILFKKEDICKSKLKSNSFDIIVCYYILNNLKQEDREKAVKEIYRIIKKSGIILFEDFQQGDFRQTGKGIEKNTIIKNNKLIHHFFTKQEVKQLFSKFTNIKIKEKSFHPFRNNKLERKLISAILFKKDNLPIPTVPKKYLSQLLS